MSDFGDITGMKNPIFFPNSQENNPDKNSSLNDSEEMKHPIIRIKQQEKNSNNNNFNHLTGMKNHMDLFDNSNNDNLNKATGMIQPGFRFINQNEKLDDMLNEMKKVLSNLQSDTSKVMSSINQLNLLISNIQKYRTNNNMNNNMQSNNNMVGNGLMNNNMMGINNIINNNMMNNNMMNDNINNIMNNFTNLNNLVNKTIIPLIGTMNINMEQLSNIPKSFTVVFREAGQGMMNKIPIFVNVKGNEKISDIIEKYREKSLNSEDNLKFYFKGIKLYLSLTADEAGLTDNANIFVVKEEII